MSNPSRPIPPEQARVMHLAICERLGVDPNIVGDDMRWEVVGGEELGRVHLTAYLPAEELIAMFNQAGRQAAERMTPAAAENYLRDYCTFDERDRCSLTEVYEIAKKRGDREHMAAKVREAGEILGLA